jgi:hypothetical protein
MTPATARAKFRRAGARGRPRPGRARPTRFDAPLRLLNPGIADHPRANAINARLKRWYHQKALKSTVNLATRRLPNVACH